MRVVPSQELEVPTHAAAEEWLKRDAEPGGVRGSARVIAHDDGQDLSLGGDCPRAPFRGDGQAEAADGVVCRDDGELALRSNRPYRDRLWPGRGERESRRELDDERHHEP